MAQVNAPQSENFFSIFFVVCGVIVGIIILLLSVPLMPWLLKP